MARDAQIADVRSIAELWVSRMKSAVIATRGIDLSSCGARYEDQDRESETFLADVLGIFEINASLRIVAGVSFDPDDIEAAFEELDARYVAGEAVAHAQTWSLVAGPTPRFNRRELPPSTPDWVNIDHRRGARFAPGETIRYIRAAWDVAPDINIEIEAVHRLSDRERLSPQVSKGASQQGFDAEWREIALLMFEGEAVNRCEIFDEADLDTALARFDELNASAPHAPERRDPRKCGAC